MEKSAQTSGLAVASLVLGIAGIFCSAVTALPGLILGIVALVKINRSEGRLTGSGLAIGGICTSAVFLMFIPITVAMLMPALSRARATAVSVVCKSNLHDLSMGMMMYRNDHDQYPDAEKWCEQLIPVYIEGEEAFQCPAAERLRCAYAMNEKVKPNSPPNTVLLFESDLGWNGSGGPGDLPDEPRHPDGHVILFVDGHVETVGPHEVGDLNWSG